MSVGITALAGGIFALNQYMEREIDARMDRTRSRPLPEGRLTPRGALWFGLLLSAAAVGSLAVAVNVLTGVLAALTLGTYLLVYTPLKTRTPHCTFIGAFPGAAPPLLGWAAATGELDARALVLFAILFFWQFPHFHSIAWVYRNDYERAGIRLWAVVEPQGKTAAWQIVAFTFLLLPASLIPTTIGLSGVAYFWGALLLGSVFFGWTIHTAIARTESAAARLLSVSVLYLPALFALMVLDR
jgi:protoheme IX farnesyltransferase